MLATNILFGEVSAMNEFHRKIFTPRLFFADLFFLIARAPRVVSALLNRQIDRRFMEKIMSVVSAVNGCVYCTWFHARQAASAGISNDEIKNMMRLQFESDATDHELVGLLYAQHYAETDRTSDGVMKEKLVSYYGARTAGHIELFIRMITFGNLYGNTFDAFLARLKGMSVHNGNFAFELIFFILNLPFMAPLLPFVKKYRGGSAGT
jgi:AhpD family alkylhydroperoxidase